MIVDVINNLNYILTITTTTKYQTQLDDIKRPFDLQLFSRNCFANLAIHDGAIFLKTVEAMATIWWYEELSDIVFCQNSGSPLQVGRWLWPHVHNNIIHSTAHACQQLGIHWDVDASDHILKQNTVTVRIPTIWSVLSRQYVIAGDLDAN